MRHHEDRAFAQLGGIFGLDLGKRMMHVACQANGACVLNDSKPFEHAGLPPLRALDRQEPVRSDHDEIVLRTSRGHDLLVMLSPDEVNADAGRRRERDKDLEQWLIARFAAGAGRHHLGRADLAFDDRAGRDQRAPVALLVFVAQKPTSSAEAPRNTRCLARGANDGITQDIRRDGRAGDVIDALRAVGGGDAFQRFDVQPGLAGYEFLQLLRPQTDDEQRLGLAHEPRGADDERRIERRPDIDRLAGIADGFDEVPCRKGEADVGPLTPGLDDCALVGLAIPQFRVRAELLARIGAKIGRRGPRHTGRQTGDCA